MCPHDETHCLIDYHIVNRVRSGLFDKNLQQELLQKADTLKTLSAIASYCENYELAKKDKDKLSGEKFIAASNTEHDSDLSQDEIVAAISQYKKNKKHISNHTTCGNCGYEHQPNMQKCPAQGKTCNKCGKKNHFQQVCHSRNTSSDRNTQSDRNISSMLIGTLEWIVGSSSLKVTSNHLPKLDVKVKVDLHNAVTKVNVVADTGAQVTVAGPDHLKKFKIRIDQLKKPPHLVKHAGGYPLKLIGSYKISVIMEKM